MIFQKLAQPVKWLYFNILNFIKSKLWPFGSQKIPGPFSLPILGSSWLYSPIGPYTHDRQVILYYSKVSALKNVWNFGMLVWGNGNCFHFLEGWIYRAHSAKFFKPWKSLLWVRDMIFKPKKGQFLRTASLIWYGFN